ncbi:outer membrane receptor protein involved in Fe transport [Ancylobacter sp. 3268]|uniref:TonB-dependent siderophore receptor n=1 Tax=Ancylobacter sp. 3268 TaxID=2817752 RepID=UPI0028581EAD|nr:TonB-dependent receptor plug domain-containing protein [Ancylobacter sp. 3268]MDR6955327.1 outer membrane receptor protein involved in Fe transport [Ancylobacter sp. 3268]
MNRNRLGAAPRSLAGGATGASVLVMAMLVASPATLAQETSVAAAQRSFSVAAGPLSSALVVFGRQAGVQISYVPSVASGVSTPGVSGGMSVQAALARLLAGTGLAHEFQGATVVIRRPAPLTGEAPGGAIELDTIDVAGDGTDGFVATRTDAGTKTNTPLIEVPQSISVVTRAELDVRNVQTDAEALTYTPGIYAQPFGGAQNQQNPYYIIRGFPSAQGGSYVDGLISFINYRYEPYGYSRYDVVRGPSSSLYGQSDPGGLVNRVSKLPTEQPFGEIQVQGGTFDRLQGAFDIGGPLDKDNQFLYRLTGLFRDGDAPITYDYGITSPDERQFIAPALTWQPNEDTKITFLGNYLKDKIGQENSFMWPQTRQLTHLAILPSDYGIWDQEQYSLGYLLEHNFTDNLTFRQNLRYSHMESNIRSGWVWDVTDGMAARVIDGNDERRSDLVMDNQVQYEFGTGPVSHSLLVGFDYQNTSDWIAFVDNWDARRSTSSTPTTMYRCPARRPGSRSPIPVRITASICRTR